MTCLLNTRKLYRPSPIPKSYKAQKIFGYDVETSDNNQNYVLGCLYISDNEILSFTSREFFKQELLLRSRFYKGSIIAAHNLAFDFCATFQGLELSYFKMCWAGSRLLSATTYVEEGMFTTTPQDKKRAAKITFLDTMNYCPLSLKQIGEIIGELKQDWDFEKENIPEIGTPKYEIFKAYNINDAKIARKYLIFLAEAFYSFGTRLRITIASTAEKIYRNRFLKDVVPNIFEQLPKEELVFCFLGYYGGRTEVFNRGPVYNRNCYDINSLYPSVMRDEVYPDTNTSRFINEGNMNLILTKEGFSEVDIEVDKMQYPLLPYRDEKTKKVLFPYGKFTGVWPHPELRKALELGYKITKFRRCLWFDKTCRPFKGFVEYMYGKRLEYKEQQSPMEFVTKIIMNSLYGKFGQKFDNKDTIYHINALNPQMLIDNDFEFIKDFVIIKEDKEPSCFSIPAWSAYVTCYGRLKLYEYIIQCEPDMVDTDSVITEKQLPGSSLLGDMKHEYHAPEMIIVRPKFYGINPDGLTGKSKREVKCKGMKTRLRYIDLVSKLIEYKQQGFETLNVEIRKFIKFRESLRRDKLVNSIEEYTMHFSLEDDKRVWGREFHHEIFQKSEPKQINRFVCLNSS